MNKTLRLSSVDCRFIPESGNIELTTKDKKLAGKQFKVTLNKSTESYDNLFNHMVTSGIVDLDSVIPKGRSISDVTPLKVPYKDVRTNFNLGVQAGGKPFALDIVNASNLLICGSAGSGKSVLQRNIMLHALSEPGKIELYGVDLKKVELYSYFKNKPENLANTLEDTLRILKEILVKIENRHEALKAVELNSTSATGLPQIYLMFDEIAEVLAPAGIKSEDRKAKDYIKSEILEHLEQILALGRSSGVAVFAATQRPDATLIPGPLKSLFGTRLLMGRSHPTVEFMIFNKSIGVLSQYLETRGVCIAQVNGEFTAFSVFFAPPEVVDNLVNGRP